MIQVTCSCGATRDVAAMFAGRQVKCPECGAMVQVPGIAQPAAPAPTPAPAGGTPPSETAGPLEVVGPLEDARVLKRHLPFSSLSGACLVVAFFLPWVRTSCGTMVVAEPSGYNLATNTVDANTKALEEKSTKLMEKSMGGEASAKYLESLQGENEVKNPPWGSKSPELWVFPALGAALLAWGLFRMARPSYGIERETVFFLLLTLGAGGLLAYERASWYRKKPLQDLKKDIRKGVEKESGTMKSMGGANSEEFVEAYLELVSIRSHFGFWMTLVALCFAALTLAGWLILPGSS